MNFTYNAIIEKDEGGYAVTFPQFPEAVTFGKTRQEACKNAAEVLTLVLTERIGEGGEIPPQKRVAEVVSVNVCVSAEDIQMSKCYTLEQAAEELGVSTSMVSQLIDAGKLQSVTFGKKRMVTIASVNEMKLSC